MKGPQAIDIENIDPSYFNKRNKELFDIDGVYLHGDPIFTSNPKGHGAESIFKKLANSIETKKQINNRIMDITSRPGRRPSTIDFGAFPFADMIGNSSRRGIKFVSESIRPVDIRGRLPEMLSRIDPYTNMKFSYMRDYLKVPDRQRQILYGLERGSKIPSSKELGEGLSYDGFVPNFRYWKKHVQFAKGMDGGWGIKGDTSHLHGFIEYLEKSGGYSPREIDKLKAQLKTITSKRYKERQNLGYPSMGREGAKYYSAKRALSERPEMLSLKGVFLKDLKGAIHAYNDQENSHFSGGLIPNFANIVPFKKKTIQSKNLMHQEYLKAYAEGENKFKPGQTMLQFLSQFYDRKTLLDLRKYPEDYRILSGGFVPNFANPLKDAIEREKAAGIPASNIRVEQSNQLKGPGNPMGLAVTNTRDEPAGVGQGIRRAKSMGLDPKSHGAAGGFMPNFVSGAGVQSTNFNSFNKAIKESTDVTQEKTEADRQSKEATNQRSDADAGSLQRLFFMQSAISMANGFLQQFAEDGGKATKSLSSIGMAASNAASTFIAFREFGSMSSDLNSKFAKGVGKVLGKLGPFAAGLSLAHELLKQFAGFDVFDLLKSDSEKAADSLKKLAESAEKTQSALDEANNLSATKDKMSKLEILGSRRTLKQEKELINLRIKEIKQQTSLQSKIAKVDTAHLKNKDLISQINKVKSGEIQGTAALIRVLEKVALQEAVQAQVTSSLKKFSEATEDINMVTRKGRNRRGAKLTKEGSAQIDALAADIAAVMPENLRDTARRHLSAGRPQGIAGLGGLEFDTEVEQKAFIESLKRKLKQAENNEKKQKQEAVQSQHLIDEYVKIIAAYKRQRENILHQNKLSEIANATQRKINSSLIDLQSEYQMVSNSASIEAKATLERAAMQEKFTSDNLKAQEESLKALDVISEKFINIGKISSRFVGEAENATKGIEEFKNAILQNLSPNSLSKISDTLGGLDENTMLSVNTFFTELEEQVKESGQNQELINILMKKHGLLLDPILKSTVLLAANEKGLINLGQKEIESIEKIVDSHKKRLEVNNATFKAGRKGLENEIALNHIKQKTVEGARKLAVFMSKQGDPAQAILRNLQGEADTLAVINNFQKIELQH